jgi:hypothetical protein
MIGLQNLPQIITAIGGLGTAAFGVVDATKVFGGGVNRIGFHRITMTIKELTPSGPEPGKHLNALSQHNVIETLKANWYNGTDLGSQKAIAKSLIKLHLNSGNAAALAKKTGVDPEVLKAVANSIETGVKLTPAQNDVYGRFDLIVTAMLDETYQRSDQMYRNGTRAWAVVASIVIAIAGGFILDGGKSIFWGPDFFQALIVGLLATPLAPVAKDLSTALATAVNTMQLVKK